MFVRYERNGDSTLPRHASTKAYRGFQHVEATDINGLNRLQQYGFGTPCTLVLDQSGKIREAFSGYSADLGDRVTDVVDNLLAEAKRAHD